MCRGYREEKECSAGVVACKRYREEKECREGVVMCVGGTGERRSVGREL